MSPVISIGSIIVSCEIEASSLILKISRSSVSLGAISVPIICSKYELSALSFITPSKSASVLIELTTSVSPVAFPIQHFLLFRVDQLY